MRTIKAKFNSRCAETGAILQRGTQIMYDDSTRKAYHYDSPYAIAYRDAAIRPKDWVQDPGEMAEDQWNQSQRY